MIAKLTFALVVSLLSIVQAMAQTSASPVYEWYPPKGSSFPAVIIIGGSEGGMPNGKEWAAVLNEKGYGVFSLAYFGLPSLPKHLEKIQLEYFESALDTLKALSGVNGKIGVIAVSKGTEAAFLLASLRSEISCVVAASPSHAVWQSINRENYNLANSSWTLKSQQLPYLKYDYSNGYYPIINFYKGALAKPEADETQIHFETASAHLLLLTGGKDQFWPSTEMATRLVKRLTSKNYKYETIHLNYPDAGHGFLIPFSSEESRKSKLIKVTPILAHLGGTPEGFEEGMRDGQQKVLEFLAKHLVK